MLGGGSNVLIADEGWAGIAVKIELRGITFAETAHDTVQLVAAAGESWDAVVEHAVTEQVWGIENLSGIPGTCGGAVVQNIGAYGAAISEAIEWVEVFDLESGDIRVFSAADCLFDYRDSIFKRQSNLIVTRVALNLLKDGVPNTSYRDLRAKFEGTVPPVGEIRDAVIAIRKGKFPDLSKEGSAGSFFKNPMLPKEAAVRLQHAYPGMPLFDMPETTNVKVPLAWLLDKVLHLNGFRIATARLFEKQPIVLVADRGATAREVRALADDVRRQVYEKFGFEIEEEVKVLQN